MQHIFILDKDAIMKLGTPRAENDLFLTHGKYFF
jgi:hypothetical protein